MKCLEKGLDIVIGYYYHQYQDIPKLSYELQRNHLEI